MEVLVVDLDNTLYDWVSYFATSFEAMLDSLSRELSVEREELIQEFKAVHMRYRNSEQPFAVLELPSVRRRFPNLDRRSLMSALDRPLGAFAEARRTSLNLYPTVEQTLSRIEQRGVTLVGHTEAPMANAYYRLNRLGIAKWFRRLYTRSVPYLGHPDRSRGSEMDPPGDLVTVLPPEDRKPNSKVLIDICSREGVETNQAAYVGDSLVRDISMARGAGVFAIWARYGTDYDKSQWNLLVKISHWSEEDVLREEELERAYGGAVPDAIVDSFVEVLKYV